MSGSHIRTQNLKLNELLSKIVLKNCEVAQVGKAVPHARQVGNTKTRFNGQYLVTVHAFLGQDTTPSQSFEVKAS